MKQQTTSGELKGRKVPEVIFSLEIRPATNQQTEAGKRLFSRLVNKAINTQKQSEAAEKRARVEAEAPPAANSDMGKG